MPTGITEEPNGGTPPETPSRDKSLAEVHSSVETQHPKLWKRIFAFAGPAYLVSVGYMDPGNWATGKDLPLVYRGEVVEMMVMGSHGHRLLSDLLWGETVDSTPGSGSIARF